MKSRASARSRSGTLGARTADRLRESILRGEFAMGQALREVELGKTLGVSRIPLREALHRLEGEGLVVIRPNRGAKVVQLTKVELLEIGEACRLIECHLLRLAAGRLTAEDLRRATLVQDELEGIADPHGYSRCNWRFHSILYAPAERPRLIEWVGALRARAELAMLALVADPVRRARLNREHRRLLQQLRRKRVTAARRLLDAHLEGGKEGALRALELN